MRWYFIRKGDGVGNCSVSILFHDFGAGRPPVKIQKAPSGRRTDVEKKKWVGERCCELVRCRQWILCANERGNPDDENACSRD
jgi:hypothetical protein